MLLVLTGLALAPGQSPSVVVVSMERTPATSAFVENLRIQLTGVARVTSGDKPTSGDGAAKIAQVQAFLESTGALVAVWQERLTEPQGVVMVALALTREASDPIEVARVPVGRGIDEERVLALKVGELLHRVLSGARSEQELARALAASAPRAETLRAPSDSSGPPSAASRPVARNTHRFRAFSELGGFLHVHSTALPAPPGAKFALGAAYERPRFRAELEAGVRAYGALDAAGSAGQVKIREHDGTLGLRLLLVREVLRLGLSTELSVNLLRASGQTPDGRRGSLTITDYSVAFGPEARARLLPILELRALFQGQVRLTDERFALEDAPVAELSGLRSTAEVSLVFLTP